MTTVEKPPIHYATGLPMAQCPICNRWSGLTGIDGRECLACTGGYERRHIEADYETSNQERGSRE